MISKYKTTVKINFTLMLLLEFVTLSFKNLYVQGSNLTEFNAI